MKYKSNQMNWHDCQYGYTVARKFQIHSITSIFHDKSNTIFSNNQIHNKNNQYLNAQKLKIVN